MIDHLEILFRLLTAMLIGCAIGLDRNLHGKSTGMKTLGIVAMGAALVTMASTDFSTQPGEHHYDAVSRAIQGVITGIGFLGAGVIVHENSTNRVRGLTTAASIWLTAAMGVVCGTGAWRVGVIALGLMLVLLLAGRPLEHWLHRRWMGKTDEERAAIDRHED